MREFRDYLFALQENLQFETLADIAEDFISLRDVEPLAFSITRAGRAVSEPLTQTPEDDLSTFDPSASLRVNTERSRGVDAASVAVMPDFGVSAQSNAFVRDFTSLQEQSIAASLASTPNTQQSLVSTQQLAPTIQQSIVSTQQLAPTSQQLILIGQQLLMTEELIKPRSVQLETLAEPFESAKLNESVNKYPQYRATKQEITDTVASTDNWSLMADELQATSLSPDNLQLDGFDSYTMKDNTSFQLSERNAYDIQETGDFEQNSLVNQITDQTLFISNNEKLVKLPFTDSAAFLPKQSFTFDPSASLRVNDDSGESREMPFDELDNQSVKNTIAKAQGSANISLKAISEAAALRAIAIIEESLSQELEGRLA